MIDSEYKIGVIGSGSMGNGIAHVSAQSGFKTILIDVDQAQLDKALATIGSNLDRQIKKNIITANDKESTLLNITTSINLKDCHDMDLIVEAVPEKYDLKADEIIIGGFSQGCMITLQTGIKRKDTIKSINILLNELRLFKDINIVLIDIVN